MERSGTSPRLRYDAQRRLTWDARAVPSAARQRSARVTRDRSTAAAEAGEAGVHPEAARRKRRLRMASDRHPQR
ncbi:hypothetical protein [Streptomyces pluripotens]|uniref:hypothetical protein n=1 Tax=Streptomyces pluripotens TaxID=1355015 RepID=UPI00131EC422|nr:hypothetical protein [Streptomyces pluripotens]